MTNRFSKCPICTTKLQNFAYVDDLGGILCKGVKCPQNCYSWMLISLLSDEMGTIKEVVKGDMFFVNPNEPDQMTEHNRSVWKAIYEAKGIQWIEEKEFRWQKEGF